MTRKTRIKKEEMEKKILDLIRENPRGLTIKEIADILNICRNTAAKYLSSLARSGEIEERGLGPSKLYYPSKRIHISGFIDFIKRYGIIMVDSRYNIVNLNNTAANIMGSRSKRDYIGTSVKNYPPFLKNSELCNALNCAVYGEEVAIRDFKDAESFEDIMYYDFTFIPCVYDNGEKGAIVIMENITDLKKMVEERKIFLEEREVLYDELRQRVKDNLQLIVSMLNLQLRNSKDKNVVDALKMALNRIRSIAILHERIYSEESPLEIDIGDYIRSILKSLYLSYEKDPNKIIFSVDSNDIKLDMRKAIPCGMIITELVSNSLKHAFPNHKNGKIWVTIRKVGDICVMEIGDNGAGLPEDVDLHNPATLGLTMVKTLVEQLNGIMNVERRDGTVYRIEFPL